MDSKPPACFLSSGVLVDLPFNFQSLYFTEAGNGILDSRNCCVPCCSPNPTSTCYSNSGSELSAGLAYGLTAGVAVGALPSLDLGSLGTLQLSRLDSWWFRVVVTEWSFRSRNNSAPCSVGNFLSGANRDTRALLRLHARHCSFQVTYFFCQRTHGLLQGSNSFCLFHCCTQRADVWVSRVRQLLEMVGWHR